jgi:hypothetical protein
MLCACGVVLLASTLAACGASSAHTSATKTTTPSSVPTTPPAHGWNTVASPGVGPEGRLSAVAARSASDAWAVGEFEGLDSAQHTLVEHWDGSQWSVQQSPSPGNEANILSSVAEISASNVWAVGFQINGADVKTPLVEHWDGSQWSAASLPSVKADAAELLGVSGSSANDVWAVGDSTTTTASSQGNVSNQIPLLLHWDGSAWSIAQGAALPAPSAGNSEFSSLSSVAALAANNAWAVGGGYALPTLIEHWNGSAWSLVHGAQLGPNQGGGALAAVSADAPNDVWAVGGGAPSASGGCGIGIGAFVEHWNGTGWSATTPPTPPAAQGGGFSLANVAASAPNDVWAVGGYLSYLSTGYAFVGPVIEHWNGSAWSVAALPTLPRSTPGTTAGLEGVAAAGGSAWVVGQIKGNNGAGPTLVEQESGGQWSVMTSASPGTVANQLNAVSASSPSDAWAVGQSANGTLAEQWDGTQWRAAYTPNGALGTNALNGVAAISAKDAWAVGQQPSYAALIEHWDGTQWSNVPAPSNSSPLDAVSADSANDVWAVGGHTVLHWSGAQWANIALPSQNSNPVWDDTLLGVAALSASNVWVVGGNPPASCGGTIPVLIAHWDGHAWSLVPNTPQGVLFGVSASGPSDVWAVGAYPTLLMHYNGQQWSQVPGASGTSYAGVALRGVAARAANDAWAVGESGTGIGTQTIIEHWNGSSWTGTMASGPGLMTNTLLGVAAVSANDAWAVGYYQDTDFDQATQALIERYSP